MHPVYERNINSPMFVHVLVNIRRKEFTSIANEVENVLDPG